MVLQAYPEEYFNEEVIESNSGQNQEQANHEYKYIIVQPYRIDPTLVFGLIVFGLAIVCIVALVKMK